MRRREFIVGIGLSGGWPLVSRAQQGERVRRIGVLSNKSSGDVQGREEAAAFERLRHTGGYLAAMFRSIIAGAQPMANAIAATRRNSLRKLPMCSWPPAAL
jgi:hypothetical protein